MSQNQTNLKSLKDSNALFDGILNQSTEGITVADMEGNYLYVNPAFCKMSGYSADELLNMTVFDMKAKNQNHKSFYDSKEKYEGIAIRVNLKRKDGTEYLTEIIGDVIKVDGKEIVLGTIRDISEKYKAEVELAKLNKDLEKKVAERTEELNSTIHDLNKEILKRIKIETQLQETVGVKQMLLNEVTHRVKNNLQVISSILNIQKTTVNTQESVDVCEVTANRIHSMALIHETLYKTKQFNKINFDNYLDSLLEYLSEVYDLSKIKINSNIEVDNLSIDTASCCGMIMLELVTNAIKYAFINKKINATIDIDLKHIQDNNYYLSIIDNGTGIPDYVDFKNIDTLGLQLVHSLIEQIDGELNIKNENGAKFEITFKDLAKVSI